MASVKHWIHISPVAPLPAKPNLAIKHPCSNLWKLGIIRDWSLAELLLTCCILRWTNDVLLIAPVTVAAEITQSNDSEQPRTSSCCFTTWLNVDEARRNDQWKPFEFVTKQPACDHPLAKLAYFHPRWRATRRWWYRPSRGQSYLRSRTIFNGSTSSNDGSQSTFTHYRSQLEVKCYIPCYSSFQSGFSTNLLKL